MTDFLTNLAARAIATPALRPRTRLRFEPAPEGEAAPAISDSSSARETALTPLALTARPVAPREAAPKPDAAQGNTTPARHRTVEEPRRDEGPPRQEVAAGPVTGRSIERETTTVHHVDTTVEHNTIASHRVVEARGERSERPAPPPAPAVPPHRYDEEPPRVARGPREPPDDRAPSRPTAPGEPPAPPLPPVRTARVVPREPAPHMERRPAAQPPRRSPPPAAEPTVHVTIGRVEVRAVTAPPATPRASRRGAAMTLDDYAAKRNARERR